ncbi:hypothetical protein HN51_044262 [Arachis hypogaea]
MCRLTLAVMFIGLVVVPAMVALRQIQLNYFDSGSLSTSSLISYLDKSCSKLQTGKLSKYDRVINGIFGFGQQELYVIFLLSSQRIASTVFSHCLKGDYSGGRIF